MPPRVLRTCARRILSLPDTVNNGAAAGHTHLHYPFAEPPAHGEVTHVAEGILWIRLPLPMALDHVNCYALRSGDGWDIVDTGFDTKKTRAIWEKLLAGPLGGAPISRVIATHYYPDHIGLAGWFMAQHGAELWTMRTSYLVTRMMVLDEHVHCRCERPTRARPS